MHKLLRQLLKSGRKDALNSIEELTNSATDLGYSAGEIEEALGELGMIALNEDLLNAVTGGASDGVEGDKEDIPADAYVTFDDPLALDKVHDKVHVVNPCNITLFDINNMAVD